jgi:hypothetical protein
MRFGVLALLAAMGVACIAMAILRWMEPSLVLQGLEAQGWEIVNDHGYVTIGRKDITEGAVRGCLQFDDIACLGEVRGLSVCADWFTVEEFRRFERLTACERLEVTGELAEIHFEVMGRMPALRTVWLWMQQISGREMELLSAGRGLHELSFRGSRISSDAFQYLGGIAALETLDLSHTDELTATDIGQLTRLPRLKHLVLQFPENDRFHERGGVFDEIAKMASLESVTFAVEPFGDEYERLRSARPQLRIVLP